MATMTTTTAAPSQSLYLQNLPDKLQKPDLRRSLYVLFSTFAPVLDVTALKTKKMRGQAHILFRDIHGATQAMRACQGYEFFGKEMKISYAKHRSNTLAKLTGTFNQPAPSTTIAVQPAKTDATRTGRILPSLGKQTELAPPPALKPQDAPSPQGVKRPRVDSDSAGVKKARSEKDVEEEAEPSEEEDDDDDDEGEMEISDEDE